MSDASTGELISRASSKLPHHRHHGGIWYHSHISHAHRVGTTAYDCITRLDDMVVLNTDNLIQFRRLTCSAVCDILAARCIQIVEMKEPDSPMTEAEIELYFDRQEVNSFTRSTKIRINSSIHLPFMISSEIKIRPCVACVHLNASDEMEANGQERLTNCPTILATNRGMTYEAFTQLAPEPYAFKVSIRGNWGGQCQAVTFETGASLGITFDKNEWLQWPSHGLGGMAQGLKIESIGPVTWTFRNSDGSKLMIRTQCYFVPEAEVWLLCPQRLFNKGKGVDGKFEGTEDTFSLVQFEGCQ